MLRDEFMLLGKKSQPVTNGLILWSEGSDFVQDTETTGHSVNRITGEQLDATFSSEMTFVTAENALTVSTRGTVSRQFAMLSDVSRPKTIEIVCAFSNFAGSNVIINTHNQGFMLNMFLGTKPYGTDFYYGIGESDDNEPIYEPLLSLSNQLVMTLGGINGTTVYDNNLYLNGQFVASKNKTHKWSESQYNSMNTIRINTSSRNPVNYYCTRWYNRILTPEEIRQNYEYEKSLGRIE